MRCADIDVYGRAVPGIRRIALGNLWAATSIANEREQTVVHEVAHVVGVAGAREGQFYGRAKSIELAQANPRAAMRNADNFGYMAVDPVTARTSCRDA